MKEKLKLTDKENDSSIKVIIDEDLLLARSVDERGVGPIENQHLYKIDSTS